MNNVQLASLVPTYDMETAAQARIDKVAKHILSTCPMHTQWNTFSPISCLPNETLANIFIHCARDYHNKHSGRPTSTAPSWVNVSYVCRHWRDVALGCPTLWTYFFITSSRWTDELLARSKQAPLKIHVTPSVYKEKCPGPFAIAQGDEKRRGLYLVEQLKNYVERLQEFRLLLDFPSTLSVHLFLSELSLPAPRLQHLEISYSGGDPHWTTVLFDGDTPALRTLKLSCCPIPWYLFRLSGLTTLNLFRVPGRLQQTMEDFLATLSCMQDLTYLYLEDALSSAAGFLSSVAFHTSQTTHLPYLSRLFIVAPLSTIVAFLSCVNIPLTTEVRLACESEDGIPLDDYAPLPSLIARRFSNSQDQALSSPKIHSLIIDSRNNRQANFTFSTLECDCESFDHISYDEWDCNIPLRISLYFCQRSREIDEDSTISDICRSVPSSHVRSIHVLRPPSPWSPAFWQQILGHLSSLQYIKLSEGEMPDIASLLSIPPYDCTENQGGHADHDSDLIFVPDLKKLELHHIMFLKDAHIRSLCDALCTRNELEAPLDQLRDMIDDD